MAAHPCTRREWLLLRPGAPQNSDHGSYYYYNPSIGGNFNATLVAVYESAKAQGIPYKYILLDSWWYFKGTVSAAGSQALPDRSSQGHGGVASGA